MSYNYEQEDGIKHYSVNDVADRYGVSSKTVYKLIKNGELEAVKVAGAIRISNQSLAAYDAAHKMFKPKPSAPSRSSCIKTKQPFLFIRPKGLTQ